jgi:hypothetical protein
MSKKEEVKIPAVEESKNPVRNFALLLLLVPLAPLILIYSLITGRLQNPFIVGACLTMMIVFGGYYAFTKYVKPPQDLRKARLNKMVDELSDEDRQRLKSEFSTLRKEIGAESLPKQLSPMLDIPMNMLNINYFYFLINSDHMGANAEGAVYILKNALYSGNKKIMEAAWKSLNLIGTDEATATMLEFKNLVAKVKEKKKLKKQNAQANPQIDDWKKQPRLKSDTELKKDEFNGFIRNFKNNFKLNTGFEF